MADCRLLHGERAWLAGGADTDLQRVYQRIGWISGLCMIDDDVMVSSCCCRDDDVVMAVMAHSKSRAISPSPTHKYPINNIGIILDKFKCTNSSVKKLIQIKVGCCDWIHMYLFEKRGFCFRSLPIMLQDLFSLLLSRSFTSILFPLPSSSVQAVRAKNQRAKATRNEDECLRYDMVWPCPISASLIESMNRSPN